MRLRLTIERYHKLGVHSEWTSGEVREIDEVEARALLADFPCWFEVVKADKPVSKRTMAQPSTPKAKRKPRAKRMG